LVAAENLVVKWGETGQEMVTEFCLSVSLPYLKGSLTCRKICDMGACGFTFHPREVVQWIFIALEKSIAFGQV
jgi:hypothetical protein